MFMSQIILAIPTNILVEVIESIFILLFGVLCCVIYIIVISPILFIFAYIIAMIEINIVKIPIMFFDNYFDDVKIIAKKQKRKEQFIVVASYMNKKYYFNDENLYNSVNINDIIHSHIYIGYNGFKKPKYTCIEINCIADIRGPVYLNYIH